MKTLQLATIDDINDLRKDLINEIRNKSATKDPIKKYSKSNEVCQHFNISYNKLKKIRLLNLINAPRIGKEYYYSIEEITKALESGELTFNE